MFTHIDWTSASRCAGYPVFLQVDLGNRTLVTRVLLEQQSPGFDQVKSYKLWFSDDAEKWTEGEQVRNDNKSGDISICL